jgi:putative isomerase
MSHGIPTGLYHWQTDFAIGVDTDPCTVFRPPGSSASIFLDALMYRELLAMEYLAGRLGLHQGSPRAGDCLMQRIGVWSGFVALWSGIATEEQAERVVREHYSDPDSFNAAYGVRALSRAEKMYDVRGSGNRSSRLGPV